MTPAHMGRERNALFFASGFDSRRVCGVSGDFLRPRQNRGLKSKICWEVGP